MSLSKVTGLYERNLQKSWVPGKKLGGISKQDTFLENNRKEFAREPSSWRKAGRNSQKSRLLGKETEGIHKVASFLEESWKEFTKESASGKRNRRNLQKNCLPGKKREGMPTSRVS